MTEVKGFSVGLQQVFTHCSWYFHPFLQRAEMFWGCCCATQTFKSLHRFSILLRSGDWLSHSRTCFLCSHSFVARVLFRIIVMLKDPTRFHLQCSTDVRRFYTQNVTINGSIHPLLNTISRLVPFA